MSLCGDRKYILFGAGQIGKKALSYFRKEKVYCFADNDINLVGSKIVLREVVVDCLKEQLVQPVFLQECRNLHSVGSSGTDWLIKSIPVNYHIRSPSSRAE